MLSDPPLSAFDALYTALNMLDRSVSDSTDKLVFLYENAPNNRVALLVLWLLPLRQTLPPLYEARMCPLAMLKQTIQDLIAQKHPVLDRQALGRIATATQKLTPARVKEPYRQFLRTLWPVVALPDSPVHLSAIVFEFERRMVNRLCHDHGHHMYWRRFCLLHQAAWKQSRTHNKWPAALLPPTAKHLGPAGLFEGQGKEKEQGKEQEAASLVWPFDVAQYVHTFDTFDWIDHARPDRDYSHFGICVGVLLVLFAVRVASRCLSIRPHMDSKRIEDDILEY